MTVSIVVGLWHDNLLQPSCYSFAVPSYLIQKNPPNHSYHKNTLSITLIVPQLGIFDARFLRFMKHVFLSTLIPSLLCFGHHFLLQVLKKGCLSAKPQPNGNSRFPFPVTKFWYSSKFPLFTDGSATCTKIALALG